MPRSAHHFTPVWHTYDAPLTFRASRYGPSRKRKRSQAEEESDDDDDDDDERRPSSRLTSPASAIQTKVPSFQDRISLRGAARIDQFNVAGHPKGGHLPPAPFPHGPIKTRTADAGSATVQKDLAALKPPLYVPPPDDEDRITSLRRHHLNVLTTIMHTSLLKGDFIRAGRAWGMILRTEMSGRAIDVRTHGRWGIGAEILLRRSQRRQGASRGETGDEDEQEEAEANASGCEDDSAASVTMIGDDGYGAAKDYYERLILQHPFQKTHPHHVSALTFYSAVLGLRIHEIQDKCRRALRTASRASVEPDGDDGDEGSDDRADVARSVKQAELDMALELAAQMDELMLSPPYDAHAPLLQLRAMVALWVADLCRDAVARSTEEESRNAARAMSEGEKAERCLAKLKNIGAEIPELVGHVLN
ncbi:hypothetical protein MBLNU459_g1693t1 [Dothideomycetes sp. NU459]